MILAGDIGGTKCRLALFPPGSGRREPLGAVSLPSAAHGGLEAVLDAFLGAHPRPIAAAAFGVAGPVVDGAARITNLPWTVREDDLARHLGTRRVRLANDLIATALGLDLLRADEMEVLQEGSGSAAGTRGLIAPGTGLGEAGLVEVDGSWRPLPSEGGHADFAARDETELEIWRWLRESRSRVEYETLLSGPGIVALYRFYHRQGQHPDPWLPGGQGEGEAAAAVSRAGLEGTCPACREALRRFASVLGAEAGNLALRLLATGGIYLAGGIPPKVLPALRGPAFLEAFRDKEPFADLMRRIPVRVVRNPDTALLGALALADSLPAEG